MKILQCDYFKLKTKINAVHFNNCGTSTLSKQRALDENVCVSGASYRVFYGIASM